MAGTATEVAVLQLLAGGTVSGTGNLTVTGALNWSGGLMSGAGKTIAAGTLSLDGNTGAFNLDGGRTLENRGTAVWKQGHIELNAGTAAGSGKLVNAAGGSFDIQLTVGYGLFATNRGGSDNGSDALFQNLGTLLKTGNVNNAISTRFENSEIGRASCRERV